MSERQTTVARATPGQMVNSLIAEAERRGLVGGSYDVHASPASPVVWDVRASWFISGYIWNETASADVPAEHLDGAVSMLCQRAVDAFARAGIKVGGKIPGVWTVADTVEELGQKFRASIVVPPEFSEGAEEYRRGFEGRLAGEKRSRNPYDPYKYAGSIEELQCRAWYAGWDAGTTRNGGGE